MHLACLNGQRGTAHGCPGKPCDDSFAFQDFLFTEKRCAQELFQVLDRDLDGFNIFFQQFHRGFAHNAVQLFF